MAGARENSPAANCRVVLVRPQFAGNLGAAARVMRNFGLRDLVLVAPQADPADREARRLSTHGEAILDAARIVADLGEAVADCGLVAATSSLAATALRSALTVGATSVNVTVKEVVAVEPSALVAVMVTVRAAASSPVADQLQVPPGFLVTLP